MHIFSLPFIYIGFLLIIIAAWLQGKVDTKDVGVFAAFVGILASAHAVYYGWVQSNFSFAGGAMLFGMTYLWLGANALRGAEDQRAFGIYCLLVAIMTLPFAYLAFESAPGWTFEWLSYGALWYLFFEILYKGNTKVTGVTIALTYFVGIEVTFTGWLFMYDFNLPVAQSLGLA